MSTPSFTPEQIAEQQARRAARAQARTAATAAMNPAERDALLADLLARALPQLGQQPVGVGPQNPANQAKSQQLADVKQITPTATARVAVPPYVLAQLPAEYKQLEDGTAPVPLVPMRRMDVSEALYSMQQGTERTGSLKYEAHMLLSYMAILDLQSSWIEQYEALLDSVLVQRAEEKALLKAPLSGLRYTRGWLSAAVTGRLQCVESYVQGGSSSMQLFSRQRFEDGDTYTVPNAATKEHMRITREAELKVLAKQSAEQRLANGRRGNNRGGGSNNSNSRGGYSGGRGNGRGGSNRDEGSSSGAGADRP